MPSHSLKQDLKEITEEGADRMADYKIVKYCRWCKKRFVVGKVDAKKNYCEDCHIKAKKYYESKGD